MHGVVDNVAATVRCGASTVLPAALVMACRRFASAVRDGLTGVRGDGGAAHE